MVTWFRLLTRLFFLAMFYTVIFTSVNIAHASGKSAFRRAIEISIGAKFCLAAFSAPTADARAYDPQRPMRFTEIHVEGRERQIKERLALGNLLEVSTPPPPVIDHASAREVIIAFESREVMRSRRILQQDESLSALSVQGRIVNLRILSHENLFRDLGLAEPKRFSRFQSHYTGFIVFEAVIIAGKYIKYIPVGAASDSQRVKLPLEAVLSGAVIGFG